MSRAVLQFENGRTLYSVWFEDDCVCLNDYLVALLDQQCDQILNKFCFHNEKIVKMSFDAHGINDHRFHGQNVHWCKYENIGTFIKFVLDERSEKDEPTNAALRHHFEKITTNFDTSYSIFNKMRRICDLEKALGRLAETDDTKKYALALYPSLQSIFDKTKSKKRPRLLSPDDEQNCEIQS